MNNVPEVLHIQQVSDVWWAINASNGYDVLIMPQSPLEVKCYQPRFIPPFPYDPLLDREVGHKLEPPEAAGPGIFPPQIIVH